MACVWGWLRGNAQPPEPVVEGPPKINQWDGQTVKNTLDDEIRKILNDRVGWKEQHSLMNGRLIISAIAVAFSGFALYWDFYHPFPKSKIVLAICSLSYFFLMGVLQLYQWYVERDTFYQANESVDKSQKRSWKWNSALPTYDDKYTLTAEYSTDGRHGHGSVTKSIGNFINEKGEIVPERLKGEVSSLYKRLVEKDL